MKYIFIDNKLYSHIRKNLQSSSYLHLFTDKPIVRYGIPLNLGITNIPLYLRCYPKGHIILYSDKLKIFRDYPTKNIFLWIDKLLFFYNYCKIEIKDTISEEDKKSLITKLLINDIAKEYFTELKLNGDI